MGKLRKDPFNIITSSVGGQGNIVSSELLGSACVESGLKVTIGETHGLSQRGGSVTSYIRVSEAFQYGPIVPAGELDLIIGFEPLETLNTFLKFGGADTVLMNLRPNYPTTVLSGLAEYPDVDAVVERLRAEGAKVIPLQATELARKAGNTVAMNIVMVGAVAGTGILPITPDTFRTVIKRTFDEKKLELNLRAFDLGLEFVSSYMETL